MVQATRASALALAVLAACNRTAPTRQSPPVDARVEAPAPSSAVVADGSPPADAGLETRPMAASLCLARSPGALPQIMIARDASVAVAHVGAADGRRADLAVWISSRDGRTLEQRPLRSPPEALALARALGTEGFAPLGLRSAVPGDFSVHGQIDHPGGRAVADVSVIDESALADGGAERVAGRVRFEVPRHPAVNDLGKIVDAGAGDPCAMGIAEERVGVGQDRSVAVVEIVYSVGDLCNSVEGKVCSVVTVPLQPRP